MAYKNPKDAKDYRRRHYLANKKKYMDRKKARRAELRVRVTEYKALHGCCRCPENDPVCLDFHHLDPTEKDINPSKMVEHGWSWERMLREIYKCVVMCANCHRKLHAES
jgi:hypothetical protein